MGIRSAFCLVALLACGGCRQAPVTASTPPPSVPVVEVTRADLDRDLELASEFKPFQEIGVFAKEAGYVRHIYVDVGDRVQAGTLLAVLEIPELNDQLNQDVANTAAANEDVARAQKELERDQAADRVAQDLANRMDQVAKAQPGLIARQEVDASDGGAQQTAAQVAAAESALAASKSRVEVAKQAENQANTLLGYARIEAPFTGVITARYADNGAMLQAGVASKVQAMPLVQLSQNDLLRLVIPVPEADVASVHLHDAVRVRVPALNREFPGEVARFADKLDLDTRTLHTEVDVPNSSYTLMPGMYAYANLVLQRAPGVLSLPVAAVNQAGGAATVQLVDAKNTIQTRPVVTGLQSPDRIEIKSGLRAGDRVVDGNGGGLRPGEIVQPQAVSGGGR